MGLADTPFFPGDHVRIEPTSPKAHTKKDASFIVHGVHGERVQLADETETVAASELIPDFGLEADDMVDFTPMQNDIARAVLKAAFDFIVYPAEDGTFERYRSVLEYAQELAAMGGDKAFANNGERATLRSRLAAAMDFTIQELVDMRNAVYEETKGEYDNGSDRFRTEDELERMRQNVSGLMEDEESKPENERRFRWTKKT